MNDPSMEIAKTVFIVDDDEAVRESLALLMRSVGLQAKCYNGGASFLQAFDPHKQFGCLVLDIRMPGMSGLELLRELQQRPPVPPIIFITAHGDVPMAVEAMRQGAVDFLQKPFRDQALLDRITTALEAAVQIHHQWQQEAEITQRLDSLTPREQQVLDLMLAGKANKVIAIDLGLSQRTVEIHRARVMEKLQVRSLARLVRIVLSVRPDIADPLHP